MKLELLGNSKYGGHFYTNLSYRPISDDQREAVLRTIGHFRRYESYLFKAANNTWLPFQIAVNNREANWIKFIVKVKGNGIGTNVAFDDLLVYNNHCAPVDVKMCDPNALQSPKWGRMPIGYWQCSKGPLIGSKCKLFCRSGFMLPRIYNKKKINSENECSRNGWIEDTGQCSTD